ncbi:MAG: hypothetical protein MUE69_27815 [Myxococcota bacterium]|jgi:hypothetical protein|nr:hypothetical protein [Myxococcota bacterium]
MSEHAHRDRALDLVYGEVEGVEARALRDELERCPECAPELAKLEGAKRLADALPLAPMPSTARAALIAAARVKANETIAALPAEDRRAAVVPREGWWDRTRRFLLGPQTAMAAVMLLVVAIGVMVVPTGDELPVGATTMRPEPDLAPDVATTPEADTLAEREPTPNPAPAQIAEAAEPSPDVAANGADVPVRRVRARSTSAGTTADRVAANAPEAERNVVARGAEAQNVEASLGDSFAYDGVAQQGNLGRGARAAEPRLAPLEEPAPPPPTMPSDDLDSESQALAPAAQELAPRALHQSARSRANAGDCRGAVRVYSDLFARFPAYSELPRALVEAAACQRQLGNLAQARTLLVRAEGYPSTQADAQRELRRLSTVQQAHRRAQRSIPAPASVDSTPAY